MNIFSVLIRFCIVALLLDHGQIFKNETHKTAKPVTVVGIFTTLSNSTTKNTYSCQKPSINCNSFSPSSFHVNKLHTSQKTIWKLGVHFVEKKAKTKPEA